jgi:iron complex transport system ATP-binding protein
MSSASELHILELKNVSYSYRKQVPLISGISLSVGQGEFIGLLGANGSGKSTIMKLGSGILRQQSGDILLWSKPLQTYHNRDRAKLISYLPQTLDITIPFTIRELVGMGLYPYDIPPAMGIDSALELVGLRDKASAHLTDLSGGERRRTFIAMTLVQGAGLLMLDEPLANLDIKYQFEILRLLRELKSRKNISIIMALHDINIALQFEKVMLIKEGKMLASGAPEAVLTKDMLKEAFDVSIEIRKQDSGEAYISYDSNF